MIAFFWSGACNINVFIDEELASTLNVSEKATFNVKTGEMFFCSAIYW